MNDIKRCPWCGNTPIKTSESNTEIFHDPKYEDGKYTCPLGYLNLSLLEWNERRGDYR